MGVEISGTIDAHFEDLSLYEEYIENRALQNYKILNFLLSFSFRLQTHTFKTDPPKWVGYRIKELFDKSGWEM